MERFAFVLHPLSVQDVVRNYPFLRRVPSGWLERGLQHMPPFAVSRITGVRSALGAEAEGWFIALPMTPRALLSTPWPVVRARLIQAARLAQRLGARIVGLGSFTKVVGDRGVSVAQNVDIAVTTGNSYTAYMAMEGALQGLSRMGHDPNRVHAAIIGATGAIGGVVSRMLSRRVKALTLVARRRDRLEEFARRLRADARCDVHVSQDPRSAVRGAELVLAVSSADGTLVEPEDLRSGAVVCDVARPRNVSRNVYTRRRDVLVIDGGVVRVPGSVRFRVDIGFPRGLVEACIAETMILALEGRYENYTLGADLEEAKVEEIGELGRRHGFSLGGFRRFERPISDEEVEEIRRAAEASQAVRNEQVGSAGP